MFIHRTMPVFFDADDGTASGGEVVEPEATETPAPEATGEEPVTEAGTETTELESVNWEERVTQWGGADTIEEAVAIQQALATPAGLQALIEEAGKALYGSNPEKAALLAQLLDQAAAQQQATDTDPLAALLGDDPERLMSAKEVAELLNNVLEEKVVKPQRQSEVERLQTVVRTNVDQAISEVGVTDEQSINVVLGFADRYISEADMTDPAKVKDAVRRGKADFDALVQRQHEEYLKNKSESHDEAPKPLVGGHTPGSEDVDEPATLEEAKARVRKAMGR